MLSNVSLSENTTTTGQQTVSERTKVSSDGGLLQSERCTVNFTSLHSDRNITGHLVCMSCDIQLTSNESCNSIFSSTRINSSKSSSRLIISCGMTKLIMIIIQVAQMVNVAEHLS